MDKYTRSKKLGIAHFPSLSKPNNRFFYHNNRYKRHSCLFCIHSFIYLFFCFFLLVFFKSTLYMEWHHISPIQNKSHTNTKYISVSCQLII